MRRLIPAFSQAVALLGAALALAQTGTAPTQTQHGKAGRKLLDGLGSLDFASRPRAAAKPPASPVIAPSNRPGLRRLARG
jgi:hypothetical protein